MKEYSLRNIDTSFYSYDQFSNLYHELKKISFDSICICLQDWFGANMSAVLAGILDAVSSTNEIKITSNRPKILTILKKNRFLSNYGYQTECDINNTTIPFLKLKPQESRFFNDYVMKDLLRKDALPEMSLQLKKKIAESIYEIFVNAQMHSGSEYIYTCGQFFPNKHKIEFTIVDMGRGFKNGINERFNSNLTSTQAIQWAIQDGHTTKRDTPGGLGLSLLKDFIKLNGGKFQIISDNGFYEMGSDELFKLMNTPFPGTIVNMEFITNDKSSYCLSSEEKELNNIF